MGMKYTEVYENGLISDEVMECIPKYCECGAEIEFTETLRQIYCGNMRCVYKVAARLESMADAMKADGWGEATCVTVCREFKMISPFQVFLLPKKIEEGCKSSVSAFEKKVASICDAEKRKRRLWEVVKLAGIPSIGTIAYKIFDGYDNLSSAYEQIEREQVPFIAEKLGLKNSEGSVMAVNVYKQLINYKDELLFGEQCFDIVRPKGDVIRIAITGGVRGFKNKSEFIEHINAKFSGRVNAVFMNSVTNETDMLVADDTSHSKYEKANKVNATYAGKMLESGKITIDEIGKYKNDGDLKKIGEKIVIGSSEQIMKRLDRAYNR